ncbi:MAG TPA: uracil-DNA glycosylase family protein [Methylococcales bacterium]
MAGFESLLYEVRSCTLCSEYLPLGPRPVLQLHPDAKILVAGQAPGRKVHKSGVPFSDTSGDRLRDWLGLDSETFYDPQQVAILPMGFCFPGTGKSGDLPPRPECATQWRRDLLGLLPNLSLTLVIGQYAQGYHLPNASKSVTVTVQNWREHWPSVVPLPHPSPRNNLWLRRNPWFTIELLPALRILITEVLERPSFR